MSSAGRLTSWITEQLRSDARPASVELRHVAAGQRQQVPILRLPVGDDAAALASRLVRAADDDAAAAGAGSGTPQHYVIVALDGSGKIRSRSQLRVAPPDGGDLGDGGSGLESEPADQRGVVAMLMRHVEAKERTMLAERAASAAGTETMLRAMTRLVDTVTAENAKLREQRLESYALQEQCLSQQSEREMAARAAERRGKLLETLAGDVKLLMPAIGARLSGKAQVSTPSAAEDLRLVGLRRLFESLSDEQRQGLIEGARLSPQQQIALGEILQGLN